MGGGRNILRGGKWGVRGREAEGKGEGSGGKGGGKRGLGTPLSTPTAQAESQEVGSFPEDVHQAILNIINT